MGDDSELVKTLVDEAGKLISEFYSPNRHQIAAIIRDSNGDDYFGIHIEAMIGRASTCAEAGALSSAILHGADLRAAVVVAVRHPRPAASDEAIRVVSPCGLCRELLLDYSADMRVILTIDERQVLVPLRDLLPHKYVGTKWS